MEIKLIPGDTRFIHNGDTTVALNKYVLFVDMEPVAAYDLSAKTTRRGTDKMDPKLGEMIAQSKLHLKALSQAKQYLTIATKYVTNKLVAIETKYEQYEAATVKEYDHLADLLAGKIVKPEK
jgi:hypothetical protein